MERAQLLRLDAVAFRTQCHDHAFSRLAGRLRLMITRARYAPDDPLPASPISPYHRSAVRVICASHDRASDNRTLQSRLPARPKKIPCGSRRFLFPLPPGQFDLPRPIPPSQYVSRHDAPADEPLGRLSGHENLPLSPF